VYGKAGKKGPHLETTSHGSEGVKKDKKPRFALLNKGNNQIQEKDWGRWKKEPGKFIWGP